jgi:hypothetical protein
METLLLDGTLSATRLWVCPCAEYLIPQIVRNLAKICHRNSATSPEIPGAQTQRDPCCQQTVQLKAMPLFGDAELWAAANSFTDVFYIMSKNNTSAEVQEALLASHPEGDSQAHVALTGCLTGIAACAIVYRK